MFAKIVSVSAVESTGNVPFLMLNEGQVREEVLSEKYNSNRRLFSQIIGLLVSVDPETYSAPTSALSQNLEKMLCLNKAALVSENYFYNLSLEKKVYLIELFQLKASGGKSYGETMDEMGYSPKQFLDMSFFQIKKIVDEFYAYKPSYEITRDFRYDSIEGVDEIFLNINSEERQNESKILVIPRLLKSLKKLTLNEDIQAFTVLDDFVTLEVNDRRMTWPQCQPKFLPYVTSVYFPDSGILYAPHASTISGVVMPMMANPYTTVMYFGTTPTKLAPALGFVPVRAQSARNLPVFVQPGQQGYGFSFN